GGSAHPGRHELWTLYAAGFITAFGAHAVAANLGGHATGRHASLVELGVLLAVCDGAEIVLKPAFGHISDRVGPRPVLIGGLVGFALASAAFVLAGEPDALDLARLSQGASSAAAFSPAAASMVAAMGGPRARGRSFGGYGAAKGSATWAGQPSEVVWSWSAATPCSSSCSPPLPAQWP
ncbi:MAG: MFS transporter, partial [Acidimicrobiales bacterium]